MLLYLYRLVLVFVAVPSGVLAVMGAARRTGHFEILNYPFPLRSWPAYALVFGVACVLWIVSLRRLDWSVVPQPARWGSRLKQRHIVTALILFKVLIAIWLCQRGFLFLSSDDFCRIDISYRWQERPFFATWDHVWLAGQFYIQGCMMFFLRDPLFTARLSALLFSVFCALALYRLGQKVFDNRVACLSLALLAVLPYPTWLSVSGHPNPFFMTFALLGTLLLVTSRGRWMHLFGAAVAFCAASSFRYEGLLLGGVYVVWNVALVLIDRRRWTAKAVTAHVALCLIPFAYIAAWSVSCYQEFGDAFRFFRTTEGYAPTNLTELGALGRMMWYPRILCGGRLYPQVENYLSPAVFFLGVAGMVATLAVARGRRGVIGRYAFVVLFNFVLLVWTAVRGTGNVMPERVVVLSQVFLVPFVAALFFEVWDRCRRRSGRRRGRAIALGVQAGVTAVVALLFAVQLGKTLDFPTGMRGVNPNALELAEALHQRFLDRKPSPEQVTGILIDRPATPSTYWVFGVMGRHFEKTFFLGRHWQDKVRANLAQRGLFLLVTFDQNPPSELQATRIDRRGRYHLWRLVNPDPATALTLYRDRFTDD